MTTLRLLFLLQFCVNFEWPKQRRHKKNEQIRESFRYNRKQNNKKMNKVRSTLLTGILALSVINCLNSNAKIMITTILKTA